MRIIAVIFLFIPLLLAGQLPELIPYKKGNLWGYSDSTGKIIIEPQWLSASTFDTNGLAKVGVEYEYLYKYRMKNKLKSRQYSEKCIYNQIINKKGEYKIPHQRIAGLMLQFNRYEFNCIDMFIENNFIRLQYNESGIMQFDLSGNLMFVSGENNEDPIYYVNCYQYQLNRQVMRINDGLYFTDRCQNLKSRKYKMLFEDEWGFGNYLLFKIMGKNGLDSITINPDGPAALVQYKQYWMFVDTSDNILYKWKAKDGWPDIGEYTHPKDSFQYSQKQLYSQPSQIRYPYYKYDTSQCVFLNLWTKGIIPSFYDALYQPIQNPNYNFILVKSDSFYSYLDTLGNLMMPLKYKKLTHYNSHYSLAFDSVWHWIDIQGNLISDKHYKELQRIGNLYPAYLAFDTAWHWIDLKGNILMDEYYKTGYQFVPNTNMSLFYDPKKGIYLDKYGRLYNE